MLLAGILLRVRLGGTLAFGPLGTDGLNVPDFLILTGFLLNAAVPPLHAWVADAYPEATPGGVIFCALLQPRQQCMFWRAALRGWRC